MKAIGIDPGDYGAIAEIADGELIGWSPMPLTGDGPDVRGIMKAISESEDVSVVFIERLRPRPPIGRVPAFALGQHRQACLDAVSVLDLPSALVDPMEWKKTVLAGLDWKKNKECAETFVRRRWPKAELPKNKQLRSGVCDAICIALYGYMRSR